MRCLEALVWLAEKASYPEMIIPATANIALLSLSTATHGRQAKMAKKVLPQARWAVTIWPAAVLAAVQRSVTTVATVRTVLLLQVAHWAAQAAKVQRLLLELLRSLEDLAVTAATVVAVAVVAVTP